VFVFSEFLQPYRERPQTSKLLADRLVAGALGIKSKMTREERVKEREKIKEAKSESNMLLIFTSWPGQFLENLEN